MKVLFAALKHDYGNPALGLSVEYTNFFDVLSHMNGVEAEFFSIDEYTAKLGKNGANSFLLEKVKNERPDLLFCYLLDEEFEKSTIEYITKKTRTKTFNWFADDHWRVPVFSRYWAPLFTLVSTTDPRALGVYESYGITNVIKSQWAANTCLYKPSELKVKNEKSDELGITFVGKKYGNRGKYIASLKKAGLPVEAFGGGWPGGRVSQEKMVETFSCSKINLNFSETHYAGLKANLKLLLKLFVGKSGDRYQFTGHRLPANFRSAVGTRYLCIKGRVFEVLACGGFLITGKTDDDISQYYVPGKEIVVFENRADLIEKCRYYLSHGEERDKIAKAGYERTLKDHTYEQRFKEIFNKLQLKL
jgi:spore maturation protein CgeB